MIVITRKMKSLEVKKGEQSIRFSNNKLAVNLTI